MIGSAGYRISALPLEGEPKTYCIASQYLAEASAWVVEDMRLAGHTNKTCTIHVHGYGRFQKGDIYINTHQLYEFYEAEEAF